MAEHKHMFRVVKRTDEGWQYMMQCQHCYVHWYPFVILFGADPVPPKRFQKPMLRPSISNRKRA
jgi:hypothetical protein